MILVVTPETVVNRSALEGRAVPRQLLGRGLGVFARDGWRRAVFWRMLFEFPLTRYATVLMPFPVMMLIWPDLALPISQAPLPMFLLVLYVESNVLSVPTPARRRALIDEAQAARGRDLVRVRGRGALTRLAAARGATAGRLSLVIEQSLMARVAPLTLISVQTPQDGATFLPLDADERAALVTALFDSDFDEHALHRINLADNTAIRSVTLEADSISAHARLAALAAARQADSDSTRP